MPAVFRLSPLVSEPATAVGCVLAGGGGAAVSGLTCLVGPRRAIGLLYHRCCRTRRRQKYRHALSRGVRDDPRVCHKGIQSVALSGADVGEAYALALVIEPVGFQFLSGIVTSVNSARCFELLDRAHSAAHPTLFNVPAASDRRDRQDCESRSSKKGTRDGRYGQLLHGMPLNGTRSIRAIVHHRERIRYRPFIRTLEWATSGSEFAPGGCRNRRGRLQLAAPSCLLSRRRALRE